MSSVKSFSKEEVITLLLEGTVNLLVLIVLYFKIDQGPTA
jgi:hypothetical protein